ncbi:MAG TPA: sigma factor, partial [Coriobacteriia bacterium]|nr:sigma factor [Coriobacteriia bacterium]
MSTPDVEGLLRELAPRALGAVVRRHGDFADAEDAVQEALLAAAQQWPSDLPTSPLGWLVTVASRRLIDEVRANDARRRREDAVTLLDVPVDGLATDDSLVLLFLCCHD